MMHMGRVKFSYRRKRVKGAGKLVPLGVDRRRRLYVPLGLEAAIRTLFRRAQVTFTGPNELENDPLYTSEQAFRCFVCKLAQVCDNERGGTTVTSFAVLSTYAGPEFLFCSNQRTAEQLNDTKEFVESLLTYIGENPQQLQRRSLQKSVLWRILLFNVPRIEIYLKSLTQALDECIADCGRKEELEDERKLVELKERADFLRDVMSSNGARDKFLSDCEALIKAIHASKTSSLDRVIRDNAKDGDISSSEAWCKLRHFLGRLHSYRMAAEALVSACEHWPTLFQNFKVSFIPSSKPMGSAVPKRIVVGTAREALLLMFSTSDLEPYEQDIASLSHLGLDDVVKNQFDGESFRPIVHCEMLLHSELLRQGMTHPSNFWQNWKFIGSSKPTCRLCSYYFAEHPDNITVRSSHRNLYPNWRLPDVFKSQGDHALTQRARLLDRIAELASQDVVTALREKVLKGKRYDSETQSGFPYLFRREDADSMSTVSEFRDQRHQVGFDSLPLATHQLSSVEDFDDEDEDDDIEGGVSL